MVGTNIRKLRELKKVSQSELAEKLGVSRQAVSMWESDKRELRATTLKKIAKIFSVTADEIMKIDETSITEGGESMAVKAGGKKTTFELKAPAAKKVALTGDFNSWDKSGIAMEKDKNGLWKTSVSLKPGKHQYKFIVDGQWWNDPANKNTVMNPLGTLNSVKDIAG
ncbi:MAG: helix-turn-helix domain-containing protein [Candidatus Omnitrophota bacterium]